MMLKTSKERFLFRSRHIERNRVSKKISRNDPVVLFFLSHQFVYHDRSFFRTLLFSTFRRKSDNSTTLHTRVHKIARSKEPESCSTKRRARAIKCIMNTICVENKNDPHTWIANGTGLSI